MLNAPKENTQAGLENYSFVSSDLSAGVITNWMEGRKIRQDKIFLLLLGPSGVGKTEVIRSLETSKRFFYIHPFTTRPLRDRETDKTYVPDDVFNKMEEKGVFACVNPIYGYKYGTPLTTIIESQKSGLIPILDFPLDETQKLINPNFDLVDLYILPDTISVWKKRITGVSRNDPSRIMQGQTELTNIITNKYHDPRIDFYLVNKENQLPESVNAIMALVNSINPPAS